MTVEQIKNLIDMKFAETITEEQIVENFKGLRYFLRCLKDIYLIDRIEWKKLLDYAYQKYITRLNESITFHAAYEEMKKEEGDF